MNDTGSLMFQVWWSRAYMVWRVIKKLIMVMVLGCVIAWVVFAIAVLAGCVRLQEPVGPQVVIWPQTQLESREQAVREREVWWKEQKLAQEMKEAQEKVWRVYPK